MYASRRCACCRRSTTPWRCALASPGLRDSRGCLLPLQRGTTRLPVARTGATAFGSSIRFSRNMSPPVSPLRAATMQASTYSNSASWCHAPRGLSSIAGKRPGPSHSQASQARRARENWRPALRWHRALLTASPSPLAPRALPRPPPCLRHCTPAQPPARSSSSQSDGGQTHLG